MEKVAKVHKFNAGRQLRQLLKHFWPRGESVIRSQKQRLTHHSSSFRTCYSLTRDRFLSLSPSLYSSSVSHAEMYPAISDTTREMGKITERQLTRIHTRYAHKSCCLATHEQGHVFLSKAGEKRGGWCGEEVDWIANEHGRTWMCGKPFLTFCKDNFFPTNVPSHLVFATSVSWCRLHLVLRVSNASNDNFRILSQYPSLKIQAVPLFSKCIISKCSTHSLQ